MIQRLIVLLFIVIMTSGCMTPEQMKYHEEARARRQAKQEQAEREEKEREDWPQGKTEEEIIVKFGVPTKVENLGALRIFYYRIDKGTRIVSESKGPAFSPVIARKHKSTAIESYDETRYVFKNGVCIKWEEHSQ
jgi:outer membrane protein assembly factor BamE (lipoprotein component of BamABCDE complex)